MKKWKLVLIMGAMIFACVGCGGEEAEPTTEMSAVEIQAVSDPAIDMQTESVPTKDEVEAKNDNYEDLEEKGKLGENAVFAEQIQAAFAGKDMEALAELCSYPLVVNGEVIEDKEAFLALGADAVFTEERCAVIEAVDASTMEETMAGVIMGDATPNVIFKAVDGKLGITGIN
ncbi:MAG: hypothetical protein NC302_09545 [Bacteroidales bacterium]|nr:hypothetical protein [Bacteroidales bacterium]MCM1415365.1 hypothetical protein [bacterium]MCM1423298.1 hypothetical protein [bacterium]